MSLVNTFFILYVSANWQKGAVKAAATGDDDKAAATGDDYAFKAFGKITGGRMVNDKEADVEVHGDMTDVDIANGKKFGSRQAGELFHDVLKENVIPLQPHPCHHKLGWEG